MSKLPKPKKPIKRQKKANGYSFPDRLPEGEVLRDSSKKEWVLGPTIGKGGFGEIYSASENGKFDATHPYAVKIEPHENGPLFMEKNFYIKIANRADVESWKQSKKIKVLGIPTYYGSGTHNFDNQKYRFMVMERYGKDLWSLFLNNQRKFPPATVYKCALQIIDTLNYIHEKDYIHGDIKGANLLLGLKSGTENNVFLVDFGLACKYTTKEFKRDPKQAHNGTIEYTSCDWHQGVPTRRGDFEILGYNLLQWLYSTLPWENDIKNKEKVYEKKKEFIANIKDYMDKHFPNVPKVMYEYFEYVSKMKYDECPNYKYCRELFTKELNRLKVPISGNLEFSIKNKKHKLMNIINNESDEEIPPKIRKTPVKKRAVKISSRKHKKIDGGAATVMTPERIPGTPVFETPTNNISMQSDDDIFFTPDEYNKSSGGLKNSSVKKETPKRTSKVKKTAETKISWKDAPTVKAGLRENKAGVYVKKNVPKKNTR
uniref:non-specific serine/threonine protein kinase n=1 Tax=Panstrongylus megistus TaxID=65343 RepID=A0A069DZ43_9HEMI